MKLKKIFLIFTALAVFSPVLTAETDYEYLLNKYNNPIEKEESLRKTELEEKFNERVAILKKEIADEKIVQKLFVENPDGDYYIMATEVTQELYQAVMNKNPSYHEGESLPVEMVSWYDAIYFCNKFSEMTGKESVYSLNGETDVSKWGYSPHQWRSIEGVIEQNTNANGFRLPTQKEWQYVAKGGENYDYAGSNYLDGVGWYSKNSNNETQPVAQKEPNGYGLYDMSGNVWEWVWDFCNYADGDRYICGGSYDYDDNRCEVDYSVNHYAYYRRKDIGFRIVCITEKRAAEIVAEKKAEEEIEAHRKKIISDEIVQSIFVKLPDDNCSIMATEVTQKQYESVMGENPSYHKGDDLPVETVSWYDAIYFCNKLSLSKNLEPVYSVNGESDVKTWNYTPHKGNSINGEITQHTSATGYRLPILEEWQYAAKGGENYRYAGSDDLDEVGWFCGNCDHQTHPVAKKKPNGYGPYDMTGNVWEWVWDSRDAYDRYFCGGSYRNSGSNCEVDNRNDDSAYGRYSYVGFRLVCPSK